ncbi:MAG: radical SAM protein [Coriobacteriaceae bacterium]|jgi:hypothetical protein|nr:radical SAM protein [Coriobacteriaceae bacterium]
MPNISLTNRCNLRCPYCFAHEFVGDSHNTTQDDITEDAFEAALEFLTREHPVSLGLIGGEPTLHPLFASLLMRAAEDPRVTDVVVFTNGTLLAPYIRELAHPKVSLLVNWNPPEMIGKRNFEAIRRNVDALIFDHHKKGQVNLGLNLYAISMDYDYLIDLLKHYGLKKLRLSLSIPAFPEAEGHQTDVLAYFRSYKPVLLDLFRRMDAIGVVPYYDCNRPPWCIWTEDEKAWIEAYVARHGETGSSLVGTKSFCRPVIDILPDLQAVRCFGMSYLEKAPLAAFGSLEQLTAHFMRLIDRPAFRSPASLGCRDCHFRRTWLCCQGCMGFKGQALVQTDEACSG